MDDEEEENPIEFVEANIEELQDLTDKILEMFEVLEYACDSRRCGMTHEEMCETTQRLEIVNGGEDDH